MSGAIGSLDSEDIATLFGDASSLQSGKLQFFALQYYLYLGLLHGLLVYPICLVSMLLSVPMIILTVLKAKQSMSRVHGSS